MSELGSKEDINKVYAERNLCAALIASYAQWFGHHVGIKVDDNDPEWPILLIDLPTGQVSWHLHVSELGNFPGINPYIGEWDGHTIEEKNQRIRDFIRLGKDGPPLLMNDETVERLKGDCN